MTRNRARLLATVGSTLTALAAAVYGLGTWAAIGWVDSDPAHVNTYSLRDGAVVVMQTRMRVTGGSSGWRWAMPREGFHILPRLTWVPSSRVVVFPLWIPLLSVLLPTSFFVRSAKRPLAGRCPSCGYDRRGLQICPECGSRCSEARQARARGQTPVGGEPRAGLQPLPGMGLETQKSWPGRAPPRLIFITKSTGHPRYLSALPVALTSSASPACSLIASMTSPALTAPIT